MRGPRALFSVTRGASKVMHRNPFQPVPLHSLTTCLLALGLVCVSMSGGCTRKCRTGTVLEGGLCRTPEGANPANGEQSAPQVPEGVDAGARDRAVAKSTQASGAMMSTVTVSAGALAASGPCAMTTNANAGAGAAVATAGQGAASSDAQSANTQGALCGNNSMSLRQRQERQTKPVTIRAARAVLQPATNPTNVPMHAWKGAVKRAT